MKTLITTLSALTLGAAFTFAEDKPPGGPGGKPGGDGERPRRDPAEMFKRLDTNNDGSISLEEFKAGPMAQRNPDRAEEAFKRMDKDADGKVTLEEMKAGRPQGGPGGRPGRSGRGQDGEGGKPGGPGGKPGRPGGQQ
jgi:hypothetical protein